MVLAGLRVGELCALRWRAVDLARARLTVEQSKTDAGLRVVDVVPMLLDELKAHRAACAETGPDDLLFPTASDEAGLPPIAHVTNHTLRRTAASPLYQAGATPPEVIDQMGHESAALALEVYTKKFKRGRGTGARMDALVRATDSRALPGTGAPAGKDLFPEWATEGTRNPLP